MPDSAAPPPASSARLHPTWYPPLQLALALCAWCAGVACAGRLQLLVAPLLAAGLVALHAAVSRRPGEELRLIISALMLGLLADALLAAAGLVRPAPFDGKFAPPWQLVQWTLPGAALHTWLRWMGSRRLLATIAAAVAAALGGLVAHTLGALRFPTGTLPALAGIALSWGLAMPMLLSWRARLDRHRLRTAAALPTPPG